MVAAFLVRAFLVCCLFGPVPFCMASILEISFCWSICIPCSWAVFQDWPYQCVVCSNRGVLSCPDEIPFHISKALACFAGNFVDMWWPRHITTIVISIPKVGCLVYCFSVWRGWLTFAVTRQWISELGGQRLILNGWCFPCAVCK